MFSLFRRGGPPLLTGDTPGEYFLRLVLLVAVLAVVGYLFYLNNERAMREIQSRGAVADAKGYLSSEQKKALREFAGSFKSEFGIRLKILVTDDELTLDLDDSKTIFAGVNPETGQFLLELPPLVMKALGEATRDELQNDVFPAYYDGGQWEKGLAVVLTMIWEGLST